MGASDSRSAQPGGAEEPNVASPPDHFVLIMTAPPGVGKEQLMGTFIAENVRSMAYVAKVGAVRANEPGLIYFYESIADAKAEVTQADSHSTILQAMQAALQDGKSVIADVDVAAVRALRALNVPGCYVFVLPASMQALQQNIAASLQDPAEGEIERTVAVSEKEILSVDEAGLYDYSIQNDDTSAALREFANLARQHGLVAAEVLSIPTATTLRSGSLTAAITPTAEGHNGGSLQPSPSGPASGQNTVTTQYAPAAQPRGAVSVGFPPQDSVPHEHAESEAPAPNDLVIPPGLERWHGSVAVVTGAGGGVGWVVCEALVAAGVRVVAAARSKERLQALQSRVLAAGAGGRMFLPVMCDITREDEVQTLMSIAVKTFDGRPVSLLVNAACAQSPEANIIDGASRAWVEMLSNNVLAVALCCREACTSMRRAASWGHVVNICPLSDSGNSDEAFLRGTTAAVRSISQGLQQEAVAAGYPLRVSVVASGKLAPNDQLDSQNGEPISLSATDVTNTVLHLISQPLHVDVSYTELRANGHC